MKIEKIDPIYFAVKNLDDMNILQNQKRSILDQESSSGSGMPSYTLPMSFAECSPNF